MFDSFGDGVCVTILACIAVAFVAAIVADVRNRKKDDKYFYVRATPEDLVRKLTNIEKFGGYREISNDSDCFTFEHPSSVEIISFYRDNQLQFDIAVPAKIKETISRKQILKLLDEEQPDDSTITPEA